MDKDKRLIVLILLSNRSWLFCAILESMHPTQELTFVGDGFVFWQRRQKGLWQGDRVWVRTLLGAYTWGTLSKKKIDSKLVPSCFQLWGHGFLDLRPDILSQWVWYPLSLTMNLTIMKFGIMAYKKAPCNRSRQTRMPTLLGPYQALCLWEVHSSSVIWFSHMIMKTMTLWSNSASKPSI